LIHNNLSDDIYPKCAHILNGIQGYDELIAPLKGTKLKKSKKVFDSSKVTDHHAIIPTGVPARGLSDLEKQVYDLIARRFISVFYPDCKYASTTVVGKVDSVEFKATGKEILSAGWRVVFANQASAEPKANEETVLPTFVKGETGPHTPTLTEKQTTPPSYYTEATLLRAMETAGKFVEDEELRAALKENGIGRPSSRAGIIETLFKRHYIRRDKKRLVATETGIQLIETIKEELLKSCELTGIWEKRLRDIEHQQYNAQDFIDGLKKQVSDIVRDVMNDTEQRVISIAEEPKATPKKRSPRKKKAVAQQENELLGKTCPKCGKGTIVKGKTAYGCSNYKECDFRIPFEQ